MSKLKFFKEEYILDYAIKGADSIVGYKDGKEICRFEGVTDFSHFQYDSQFRLPQESVNEMMEESDERSSFSEEAILDLQEAVDALNDRLDLALIDASFGELTPTVNAFARQIMKGAFSIQSVPDKYRKGVEIYLRAAK